MQPCRDPSKPFSYARTIAGMKNGLTPEKQAKRPWQFHLTTLFVGMTVAAVVFALVGRFGVDGLVQRLVAALTAAALFAQLVEFYYWWKREEEEGW